MPFTIDPERNEGGSTLPSFQLTRMEWLWNNRIWFLFYTYLVSLNFYLPLPFFLHSPSMLTLISTAEGKQTTTDGKLSICTKYTRI